MRLTNIVQWDIILVNFQSTTKITYQSIPTSLIYSAAVSKYLLYVKNLMLMYNEETSVNCLDVHYFDYVIIDSKCIVSPEYQILTTSIMPLVRPDILPLLQCTWLSVTLRSLSVSIRQLRLQVTCTCWLICKHIVVNSVIFLALWESVKFHSAKVTFTVTQGRCYWCRSTGHVWFPISLSLQLCLCLVPFPTYYQ